MTEVTSVGFTGLHSGRGRGQDNRRACQQMIFVDIGYFQERELNEIVMTAAAIRFRGQAVASGHLSI